MIIIVTITIIVLIIIITIVQEPLLLRLVRQAQPRHVGRALLHVVTIYIYIYIYLVRHGNRQDVFNGFRRRHHPTFFVHGFRRWFVYGFRRRRKSCLWFPSLVCLRFPSWQENVVLWFPSPDFRWILPSQEDS